MASHHYGVAYLPTVILPDPSITAEPQEQVPAPHPAHPWNAVGDTLANALPGFIVSTTRNVLLHITTSITKISSRAHEFFTRLSNTLAYGRMMHAMFGWLMPHSHQLPSLMGWPLAFNAAQGAYGARTASPFDLIPTAWWQGFRALTTARPAQISPWMASAPARNMPVWFGLAFVAVTPLSLYGVPVDTAAVSIWPMLDGWM
jgi:hypothetical protein